MSGFNQLMMRAKGKQPVPTNIIFKFAGQYIGLYDYGSVRKFIKKYDGLAYGGYWIGAGGSGGWRFPCFVSEASQYCETTAWTSVSTSTFSRYGKEWYYTEGISATTGGSLVVEGDVYKIENVTTPLEAAIALIDYVYTFDVEAPTEEYTQLNYVQTSGSQYIKTGITPTSNTRVVTKIEVITSTQNIPVFGCNSSDAGGYYHLTPFSSKWYYGKNGGEGNAGSYSPSVGTIYEIDFNNNGSIIINGTTIATNIGTIGNAELMIAKRASSGDVRYGYWKYYKFQIYEGSILVRDYIPVIRNSDGKVGMLEQVNNIFCPSDGSGDFIGG